MMGGQDLARCSLAELGRLLATGATTSQAVVDGLPRPYRRARAVRSTPGRISIPSLRLSRRGRATAKHRAGRCMACPSASRTSSTPRISRRSMARRSMPAIGRRATPLVSPCCGGPGRSFSARPRRPNSPAPPRPPRSIRMRRATRRAAHRAARLPPSPISWCPPRLGTQTLGSVIRPAAFCGIVGFKPSHGLVPLDGVKPSAPTMDTVGFLLRRAEDIALLLAALTRSVGWEGDAAGERRASSSCAVRNGTRRNRKPSTAIARARKSFLRGGAMR